jgi:hypothetical protein
MTTTPASPARTTPPGPGSDRLGAVLHGAVADQLLTPAQAEEVRRRYDALGEPEATGATGPLARRGRLAEVAGYAGAALVLGAAALFLGTEWSDLGEAARAAVLFGAAFALALGGAAVALTAGKPLRALARDTDSARRRLISTVWALAAAAVAGGAGVLADGPGTADRPWLAAAAAGLVAAGVAYATVPGAPGHLAAALGASVLAASVVAEVVADPRPAPFAMTLVGVAALWAVGVASGVLREREVGFAVAGTLALVGAQLPVLWGETAALGYALTAAVAVVGYAGYLAVRSWPVLAAGVIATTLVVPEALHDWTDGSVSVAGALLVAGLTLLGSSAAGLGLRSVAR